MLKTNKSSAIAIQLILCAVHRNETRELSLMPALRVNSGTAPNKKTSVHGPVLQKSGGGGGPNSAVI
jgi:hypothetical protein